MSKLDELIKELCPNGVEYKELGEVIHRHSEKPKNSNIKLVYTVSKDYGIIESLEYWKKTASEKRASYQIYSEDISNYNVIKKNMFAYNPARLNIGSIGCLLEQQEGLLSPMYVIFKIDETQLLPKYVLYYLKSPKILAIIDSKKENGARFRFDFKNWSRILIPTPPLEVQNEIVRILDNYTKSVEELKEKLNAELITRKKQYSWYRDYLLKFENKVEIVKLGNVSELKSGGTPKTENLEYWENGIIPWMSSGEVNKGNIYETEKKITKEGYENSNTKMLPKNTVVIALAGQGKTRGTVAITRIELCTNQSLCGIIPNEKLNSDYLYHYLKTQYENLRQLSSGDGTRGGLNLKMIDNYLIPLPPLEVQKRIVEVLDNFEKICNDLNIGLPAEIEARQKQYEFYRNFLLTFKIENCTLPKTRQDKTRQDIIKLFMYIFGYIELELGEIFELKNGYTPSKSNPEYWLNGNINWFKIEDINTNGRILKNSIEKVNKKGIKGKLFPENTLIISTSATIGEYALITKEFLCNQRFTCLIVKGEYKNILLPMFLKHYAYILSKKCKENIKIGNFPSVDMDKFKKFLIPLPLLEEQQRIVNILDRFDKLCNDISEGLPAEIEARQKQYEYYREKLLTFKNIND